MDCLSSYLFGHLSKNDELGTSPRWFVCSLTLAERVWGNMLSRCMDVALGPSIILSCPDNVSISWCSRRFAIPRFPQPPWEAIRCSGATLWPIRRSIRGKLALFPPEFHPATAGHPRDADPSVPTTYSMYFIIQWNIPIQIFALRSVFQSGSSFRANWNCGLDLDLLMIIANQNIQQLNITTLINWHALTG